MSLGGIRSPVCPLIDLLVNDTKFHHIAVVFDGTQILNENRLKLYIDGSIIAQTTVPTIGTSLLAGIGDFASIGEYFDHSYYSTGVADEVKIFNKAYGINDIRRLMIGQNPR
jgi:hypothetical protein